MWNKHTQRDAQNPQLLQSQLWPTGREGQLEGSETSRLDTHTYTHTHTQRERERERERGRERERKRNLLLFPSIIK